MDLAGPASMLDPPPDAGVLASALPTVSTTTQAVDASTEGRCDLPLWAASSRNPICRRRDRMQHASHPDKFESMMVLEQKRLPACSPVRSDLLP